MTNTDKRPAVIQLLKDIKEHLPELQSLLTLCNETGTDGVYRFYHGSFKVYGRLQPLTRSIVDKIRDLAPTPGQNLDPLFSEIINNTAKQEFQNSDNEDWGFHTGPVVTSYFHARFFLEQLILAGLELEAPPSLLPESWAAVLTLYNLR